MARLRGGRQRPGRAAHDQAGRGEGREAERAAAAPRRDAGPLARARHELVPAPGRLGGRARPTAGRRTGSASTVEPSTGSKTDDRHLAQVEAGRARSSPSTLAAGEGDRRETSDDSHLVLRSTRSACRCWSKASYFPNWEVDGAKGPYRVAPNFMVVVPTSNRGDATYGTSRIEYLGYALTLLGIVGLVVLWRKGPVRYEPVHRGPRRVAGRRAALARRARARSRRRSPTRPTTRRPTTTASRCWPTRSSGPRRATTRPRSVTSSPRRRHSAAAAPTAAAATRPRAGAGTVGSPGSHELPLDADLQGLRHPGTVPDQLDAGDRAAPSGSPSPRFDRGASASSSAATCGPSGVELVAAFADGVLVAGRRRRRPRPRVDRPRLLRRRPLDAPGAMFTASHNPAQYNGIKLCLAGARPVGEDTGLAEIKARGRGGARRPPARAGRDAGHVERRRPARRRSPTTSCRSSTRRARAAAGRRRHRQRHGRPGRAQGVRGPARSSSRCCTASSTARSRTTRPTRSSPRTSATSRPACVAGGADVGLAFDGDADRVFLVDEAGRGLSGSTTTAIAGRRRCSTSTRAPRSCTTYLLQGRARGHPRARRHPGPHQGRPLLHQAGDGRDRRGVRRRALGALLLPRQLPGRLRHHRRDARARAAEPGRRRRCRCCASRSSATPRRARSTPRSPTRRR